MKSTQYIQYSVLSNTFVEVKSLVQNLKKQFLEVAYCCFPIRDTLCPELSWSHYRLLMRISDEKIRAFYMDECRKAAWSVRQLERQIHTMYYQRILASKYFTYLPTEEELKRELKLDDYQQLSD